MSCKNGNSVVVAIFKLFTLTFVFFFDRPLREDASDEDLKMLHRILRPEFQEWLPLVVDLDGIALQPAAACHELDGFLILFHNPNLFFLRILDDIWSMSCLFFWHLWFSC